MSDRVQLKMKPPTRWAQELLEEGIKPDLKRAADEVAANIRAAERVPVEVTVMNNRNGRAIAKVTVKHPKALPMQIKRGAITRQAAIAGLKVVRYVV